MIKTKKGIATNQKNSLALIVPKGTSKNNNKHQTNIPNQKIIRKLFQKSLLSNKLTFFPPTRRL